LYKKCEKVKFDDYKYILNKTQHQIIFKMFLLYAELDQFCINLLNSVTY